MAQVQVLPGARMEINIKATGTDGIDWVRVQDATEYLGRMAHDAALCSRDNATAQGICLDKMVNSLESIFEALKLTVDPVVEDQVVEAARTARIHAERHARDLLDLRERARTAEAKLASLTKEASGILMCGTDPALIIDAITRKVEAVGPNASVIAQERAAHDRTKADLQRTQDEQAEYMRQISAALGPKGKWGATARSATPWVGDILALVTKMRALTGRIDHLGGLLDVERGMLPVEQVLENCITEVTALNRYVGEKMAHDVDGQNDETPDASDAETAYELLSADMAVVFESLHTSVVLSSADYAASKTAAWIYGIVVGWDAKSLAELQATHGFTDEAIARLGELRSKVEGLL